MTRRPAATGGRRPYRDRRDAGRELASLCAQYSGRGDTVVLGLPRGGVPVAYEVAVALGVELDVFMVRKLGVPGHEELAMGAVASGGVQVLNHDVLRGIDRGVVQAVAARERRELDRREVVYRGSRPPLELEHRTVLLVDDGLATGASMRAAVEAVRLHEPTEVIVAVPAAPHSTCDALQQIADVVICAWSPSPFYAVGAAYDDFTQTTDDEVVALLRAAAGRP